MGLIKSAKSAIGSTLNDQWKEAIRCEEMGNDVLMVRKTTETGVISNGSTIIVAPGQCAIIFDNGKVIDATAEEGVYTFDESSTPSFFAGQFGAVFKEMWQRFTYNGVSAKQQVVFFFNITEIMDNKFGTQIPVPFQDWSHPTLNEITNTMSPLRLEIKCFGKYTFRISNPAVFMSVTSGANEIYKKYDLEQQMKSEINGLLQNLINELGDSEHKVPVLELPSKTDEIKEIIATRNLDEIIKQRGVSLVGFTIESVTLTDESETKIDNYEHNTSSVLQKARMVEAYSNAMEGAATNSHGVLNGMMGVGIMNMATGDVLKEQAQKVFGSSNNQANTNESWECENCKIEVNGKYCSQCGKEKVSEKFCTNCGVKVENDAKFCSNCGKQI